MSDDEFDELGELKALAATNDEIGRSFILRSWWHQRFSSLVRRGLVKWSDPPKGFDKRKFAGIHITVKGRKAITRRGDAR